MKIRNLSSRNLYLRDSSGNEYRVNAYGDLTLSDTLWLDNEFRRWIRFRVRDIAVVDNDASVSLSTLINTGDPLSVPFTVRGASGQNVDLFQLQDNTTAVLARITKTGTIGIGVNPLTPLHITGGITASGGQLRVDASTSNTSAALSLFPNRSGSIFEAARVLATYNGANQGQLLFYTNDGSGTLQQRTMIDETGKFGIGGSPTKTLDVITAAQGDISTFRTTASSGQGFILGVDTTNSRTYLKLNTSSTYSFAIQDISGNPMLSTLNTDGKVYFGSPLDTNLYRNAADTLKTDDSLVVAGNFSVTGTATAPTPTPGDSSTKIATTAFVSSATTAAGTSGTLASRPAASAATGLFYYATDQVTLYFSNGTSWFRMNTIAGVTQLWFKPDGAIPAGYVAYDGSALPASTGIYADLFAHLGTTTTPDTRGRMPIAVGTHADINAVGLNDGVAIGSRRPKHKHVVVNPSIGITDPQHSHIYGRENVSLTPGGTVFSIIGNHATLDTSTATSGTGISATATGGTVGPQTGSEPIDTVPYIATVLIAKL